MLEVEVFKNDEVVDVKRGTSKKGNEYVMFSQRGYINLGGQYPVAFKIRLDEEKFYPSGKYLMSPESFVVNDFGELQAGRVTILVSAKS